MSFCWWLARSGSPAKAKMAIRVFSFQTFVARALAVGFIFRPDTVLQLDFAHDPEPQAVSCNQTKAHFVTTNPEGE